MISKQIQTTRRFSWSLKGLFRINFTSIRKIIMYIIYCSCKIFRFLWLAPIPRLILHNQPALNKFGRCKQYTIDSIETRLIYGIFDWKRGFLGNKSSINVVSIRSGLQWLFIHEWTKKTCPSWLSEDEIAEFLTKTEWKESGNTQNILLDGC